MDKSYWAYYWQKKINNEFKYIPSLYGNFCNLTYGGTLLLISLHTLKIIISENDFIKYCSNDNFEKDYKGNDYYDVIGIECGIYKDFNTWLRSTSEYKKFIRNEKLKYLL